MEQFVVSARKYRPATFESVVGQEHITQTLKNAISQNHLAQAFLFCGPRGVGKTTCARILAKTINCSNLKENIEPCNTCDSCVAFNKNASFTIYELDAASNNSVDDIRALVEQVRYAPQGAKYKIYIIDEVHMLSTAAFNAFLKTLEEPPSYAIFILATTERHKILPTILSRCQIFDFNRITIAQMMAHLASIAEKEGVKAEPDALHIIAEKADGALRDALSIFDQMVSFSGGNLTYESVINNLNILDYDYYFRTVQMANNGDSAGLLLLLDEVLRKGFDTHLYLGGLCDHIRNLLICKDPQTMNLLEVAETAAQRYVEQSKELSASYLFNALQLMGQYDSSYKTARNQRLHVELALLKLANLNRALQLALEEKKKPLAEVQRENASASPITTPKVAGKPASAETLLAKPKPKAPDLVIPDIKLALGNIGKTKVEEKEELPEEPTLKVENLSAKKWELNAESVQRLWNDCAKKMEEESRLGLSAGMRQASTLLNERVLAVSVSSKTVADFVNEVRGDILSFINQSLLAPIESMEITVEKQSENSSAPYTLDEKLKFLVNNNAELPQFMRTLGLELDY